MAVIFPNIIEIEYVACDLAKQFMTWGEPIPDFSTRFPNILESCIATPQQIFNGNYLYPGLYKKASILFYLMIKNHPFKNGNKRIAVMTLLYFLHKNKRWINISNQAMYKLAKYVAESDPSDKDYMLRLIHNILKDNIKKV